MNVIGYARVSTEEQGADGAGMKAQTNAIEAACKQRGWTLTTTYMDVASGATMEREGLRTALADLAHPKCEKVLVVAKLDRLSRSLLDFAQMMEKARKQGWAIVALDLGLDMTTPAGALVANVMAAVAEWERQTISQRTKAAMAVKKANGVHCGRSRQIPEDVVMFVRYARETGRTYRDIAADLEARQVPTVNGGAKWQTSTLRRIA